MAVVAMVAQERHLLFLVLQSPMRVVVGAVRRQ
jgi:hypothetical protein